MKKLFTISLGVTILLMSWLIFNAESNHDQVVTKKITSAYLQYGKEVEGTAIECSDKIIREKLYVYCKRWSSNGYTNAGLWLVEKAGESYEFYALNGKAATALKHFKALPNFKRIALPLHDDIDIEKVLADFGG